jgi:hypothetical protein
MLPFKKSPVLLFGYQFVAWRLAAAQLLKLERFAHGAELQGYSFYTTPPNSWLELFKKAGCPLGLTCHDQPDEKTINQARKLLSPICDQRELLSLSYDECLIGDLVFDTFLNIHSSASLNVKDQRLLPIVSKVIQISNVSNKYFDRNQCKAVITDQNAFYIYNGVISRIAHLRSIPVYDMIHRGKLGLFPIEFPEEQRGARPNPYWKFREQFQNFDESVKAEAYAQAERTLKLRLSGAVDNSTLPLRSAYQSSCTTTRKLENHRQRSPRAFLVFLHEFSDAPHCYRWGLFDNFEQWIEFILSFASRNKIRVYIKPHPASFNFGRSHQKKLTENILESLKIKYPDAIFLDGSESNHDIRSINPDLVLTVHGTIAHEMAYLGEKVVNAGDNPHIQYNFCAHPNTIKEYEMILSGRNQPEITINEQEILEFIYMRFIYPFRYLNEASFASIDLDFEERSHCESRSGLKLASRILDRCL